MSLSKTAAAAATLLLVAASLQACGRKGPLYMQQIPANPPPSAAQQKPLDVISPAQSQPVPTQTESQKQP